VICGYHWQSDVDAARIVGSAVVATLHTNPAFQQLQSEDEFADDNIVAVECPEAASETLCLGYGFPAVRGLVVRTGAPAPPPGRCQV
jgi:hypothetical protein